MRSNENSQRLTLVIVDSAPALTLATETRLFALGHALFEAAAAESTCLSSAPRLRLVPADSPHTLGEVP